MNCNKIRPGDDTAFFHFHIVGKDVVFLVVLPRLGTTKSVFIRLVDINVVILIIKPNCLQLKER